MKLHEYQAKHLLASAGVPVPESLVATTPAQAAQAYEALRQRHGKTAFACNLKTQLHAGGRGKAGGILVVQSAQEASAQASQLLSRKLVTAQTGPEGLPVSAVLLEERVEVTTELYVAVTLDRFGATPVILTSRRGGVDIEEVAAKTPKAIVREAIDVLDGPSAQQLARIAAELGVTQDAAHQATQLILALWRAYEANDASLIEINPLVITQHGRLLALDAKVIIDDNALFRHPDLAALRDPSQEHPIEYRASQIGIAYVGLDGTIGCLVNGAGLAMATNDIIKLAGGAPANFLDVGGGANIAQVTNAFSIILADTRVRAILVNIFGGIMRCDWIAQGLLNATKSLNVNVPIVVRLEGTNVEEGRRLLSSATSLHLISVPGLAEAAKKVVELASK